VKGLIREIFHLNSVSVQQAVVVPVLFTVFCGFVVWIVLELIKVW